MAKYATNDPMETCYHCDKEFLLFHAEIGPDIRAGQHMSVQDDQGVGKRMIYYMYDFHCPHCLGFLYTCHLPHATVEFAPPKEEWFRRKEVPQWLDKNKQYLEPGDG